MSGIRFHYSEILEANEDWVVVIGKIYMLLGRHGQESFLFRLWESNIHPIYVPVFPTQNGDVKSLADPRMICDIIEVLYNNPNIDLFVIVSGDKDFIPVIRKIAEKGKNACVIGVGKTTADSLVNECNRLNFNFFDFTKLHRRATRIKT